MREVALSGRPSARCSAITERRATRVRDRGLDQSFAPARDDAIPVHVAVAGREIVTSPGEHHVSGKSKGQATDRRCRHVTGDGADEAESRRPLADDEIPGRPQPDVSEERLKVVQSDSLERKHGRKQTRSRHGASRWTPDVIVDARCRSHQLWSWDYDQSWPRAALSRRESFVQDH